MRSPVGNHELRQLEGNAQDLWDRGDAWVKLGGVMRTTATSLEDIADSSICKSQGTDKLAEMAEETAGDLAKAAVRYTDTGKAVRTYASALDVAQTWIRNHESEVERAERDYQSAAEHKQSAARELSSLETVWVWESEPSAAELSAAENAAANAASALTTATNHRNDMWEDFDHTFETWSTAYDDAVTGIQKAMDTAGNNDGFWEFVDSALEVLGWVLVALTVIALIIGAPLAGLLAGIILALSVLVLALTALKFATGRATLSDLGLAALSLVPFGIGRLLSKGAPALSAVVRNGRTVVTSTIRAGIPRMRLLRPTTWAKPFRWLAAPSQARGALPRPGMFVNPFRSVTLGDARLVQVENFLGTMRTSPWSSAAPVQQFVATTAAAMPSLGKQAVQTGTWLLFTGLDSAQAGETIFDYNVEIPGLSEVRLP